MVLAVKRPEIEPPNSPPPPPRPPWTGADLSSQKASARHVVTCCVPCPPPVNVARAGTTAHTELLRGC